MRLLKKIMLLIGVSTLHACMVGPNYKPPLVAMPLDYKEARHWKIAEPRDDVYRGDWWKIFHDQELNTLENKLNQSNLTIAQAVAKYDAATALIEQAQASYYPTLNSNLSMTRSKISNFGGSPATSNTQKNFSNTRTFNFTASWVPDLWGSVRRNVEAQRASAQATKALLANTALAAQVSLAQTYYQLRAVDRAQRWLDQTVIAYQKLLRIADHQYKAGIVARVDVLQAQSQWENAKATALNNKITRAKYEHAIAVLIGVTPEELAIDIKPLKITMPKIPLVFPSKLLERRPDIAAAERSMAQMNALIGVATASYFPDLTLSATAGLQNKAFSQILSLPSLGWSIGPQLALTILNGGLRQAQIKAAKANYLAATAAYKATILAALQDVEDNLVTLRYLDTEVKLQLSAVANAQTAVKILLNQYRAGVVNYTNVANAQTTAYTVEKNAVDMESLQMTATIGLIAALGGSWDGDLSL